MLEVSLYLWFVCGGAVMTYFVFHLTQVEPTQRQRLPHQPLRVGVLRRRGRLRPQRRRKRRQLRRDLQRTGKVIYRNKATSGDLLQVLPLHSLSGRLGHF